MSDASNSKTYSWINTNDSLPPSMKLVWCYGYYDNGSPCSFEVYRAALSEWFARNNGDYVDGGYGNDYEATVTHWMHLPEPPNA